MSLNNSNLACTLRLTFLILSAIPGSANLTKPDCTPSFFETKLVLPRFIRQNENRNLRTCSSKFELKDATCSRRLQIVRLKLLIKYQCCGGSLQGCHQKNIRFDWKWVFLFVSCPLILSFHLLSIKVRAIVALGNVTKRSQVDN